MSAKKSTVKTVAKKEAGPSPLRLEAARAAVAVRLAGNVRILRECLRPWMKNPRKTFDAAKLQQLADSMRAVGQLQALLVRAIPPTPGGVTHEVIVGERRYHAAERAGLESLEARVVDLDDKAALELAVMENVHRADLDVIEEAEGYAAMVAEGWDVVDIAQRSGRSKDMIYELLGVCRLDAGTQNELRNGTISRKVAEALGGIDDLEARSEALQEIIAPKWQKMPLSRDEAMRMIKRDFLEPQKQAETWAKGMAKLAKKFPQARVLSMQEWNESAAECVDLDAEIPEYLLAEHAKADAPTWELLAKKHGSPKWIVPDGEDSTRHRCVALRAPMEEAERALGEKAPLDCMLILKGRGRHEQSLAAQRGSSGGGEERGDDEGPDPEDDEVDEAARESARDEVMRTLWRRLTGEGMSNEALVELTGWAIRSSLMRPGEIPLVLGVDLQAMGGGSVESGLLAWAEKMVQEQGLWGVAALALGTALGNMRTWNDDFEEDLAGLVAILGE